MNKRIKIGLFIDTFYPMIDGVVSVVDNYAKRLINYGDVTVFAPEYPGQSFDDDSLPYRVVRSKSSKLPIIDYSLPMPGMDKKFKEQLDKSDLDIVHIHSPFDVGKSGIDYAQKHNIPCIATMHSQFKQDFKRATKSDFMANRLTDMVIKQFNRCDESWAVNSKIAEIYYKDYKYKTLPRVMNNATEMLPLKDVELAKETINQMHNIDKNDKVFLFVGRINNLKNIFFIADSLKILKDKNPMKFKMLFVGTGQDEQQLKEVIAKNNMEEDIYMCGKVTDRTLLAQYFARADLFLFPSLYDASSIVQIEAASQKTPSVFIEGAATSATITDNVTGFISKNDTYAFADKIIEIMENPKLYKEVSDNVFDQIYVNWDDKIKEVFNLYMKFIDEKK